MSDPPQETGLGPALNRALRAISEAAMAPWAVLRPGARVLPFGADEDEASQAPTRERTPAGSAPASQAPTREATPAPEPRRRTPTPGPRPVMVPEAVPEEEPEPAPAPEAEPAPRPKRRRRAQPAAEAPEPGPNWRRPLDAEAPQPEPRARIPVESPALALVRRARAWRAKGYPTPDRVTPAAYDAVDAQARFGLIEQTDAPQPWPGQTLLLAHTPPRRDPAALLDLRPGDTLSVLSTRPGAEGWAPLRVQFVTRSRYFAPGRQVTSVALGVRTDEWAHATRGRPASE